MPPGLIFSGCPLLTNDVQGQGRHVLLSGGGAELYSLPLDILLDAVTANLTDIKVRGWPEPIVSGASTTEDGTQFLPSGIEQIQAGFTGDKLFATTTNDGRFLYATGDVSDLYVFKLDPTTGKRIDGGRRFFTQASQAEHDSNLAYVERMTILTSLTLSADDEQRFVYAAGKELHALVRNTTSGALFNRTVFPLPLLSTPGLWGTPVSVRDPFPHLFIPDGRFLRLIRADPVTGQLWLPEDPDPLDRAGVVYTLAAELTAITALAVERNVIYLG
jgi:hypothetical protein